MARRPAIGWALFAAGVALAGFGVLRGEHQQVLFKAILICLECIGLR